MAAAGMLAAACAPLVNEPGPPVGPARLEGSIFVTADGVRLPIHDWQPPAGPPRVVIVALHGFTDYGHFFDMPGRWLADHHGIASYAYDQRGSGGAPDRGLWPGTDALVDDARTFVDLVRRRHPGVPLVLLGESMGGAVALAAAGSGHLPAVDGVVLVAPAVWARETMPLYQRLALAVASWTVPWLPLTGQGLGIWPSDNIEMLRRHSRDPLVQRSVRVDAVRGLADLMDAALAAAGRLPGPALVLYGAHDQIIRGGPTRAFLDRLPAEGGWRLAVYPDGYHMLLRDLAAEIPWRDLAAWIADPDAPLPSGLETRGLASDGA